MAVRMRLMRMGKKKQPMYRVVVIDGRAPRDGRYIEQIGRYEPLHDPSIVEIDNERAIDWLSKGASPSETVEKLLNISGAMNTMKVQTGGIHVIGVEASPADAGDVGDSKAESPADVGDVGDSASSDEEVAESPADTVATEEE
jgi:small subunit ribosomal protein S16